MNVIFAQIFGRSLRTIGQYYTTHKEFFLGIV